MSSELAFLKANLNASTLKANVSSELTALKASLANATTLAAKVAVIKNRVKGTCPYFPVAGGGVAAANVPFVTYRDGGSTIPSGAWKGYVISPPPSLCGGKTARLSSATIALANNVGAGPVTANVRGGVFAVNAATLQPSSPLPLVESRPVAVTVPLCTSPCAPAAPSPNKPEVTLALGAAAKKSSPAWTVTPGVPFLFAVTSDYAGPFEDLKWANVVTAAGPEADVAGVNGFVVSPTAWKNDGGWTSAEGNAANQLSLEFQCFVGGCWTTP